MYLTRVSPDILYQQKQSIFLQILLSQKQSGVLNLIAEGMPVHYKLPMRDRWAFPASKEYHKGFTLLFVPRNIYYYKSFLSLADLFVAPTTKILSSEVVVAPS